MVREAASSNRVPFCVCTQQHTHLMQASGFDDMPMGGGAANLRALKEQLAADDPNAFNSYLRDNKGRPTAGKATGQSPLGVVTKQLTSGRHVLELIQHGCQAWTLLPLCSRAHPMGQLLMYSTHTFACCADAPAPPPAPAATSAFSPAPTASPSKDALPLKKDPYALTAGLPSKPAFGKPSPLDAPPVGRAGPGILKTSDQGKPVRPSAADGLAREMDRLAVRDTQQRVSSGRAVYGASIIWGFGTGRPRPSCMTRCRAGVHASYTDVHSAVHPTCMRQLHEPPAVPSACQEQFLQTTWMRTQRTCSSLGLCRMWACPA